MANQIMIANFSRLFLATATRVPDLSGSNANVVGLGSRSRNFEK